jgi:S-adenosylmethionine:tRNA ribosyltransferase-isomerase
MLTRDFWYDLPDRLIAQHPAQPRDTSRLLVLNPQTGAISHGVFHDVADLLHKGDCLVINNTRVIPARLLGVGERSGAAMEFVLLKRLVADEWEVLVKPGKKARTGTCFSFGGGLLKAEVIGLMEDGTRRVRFHYDGVWEVLLDKVGIVPLPPYVTASLEDRESYQTVYARFEGSAAAPTAGLHFTKELLEVIQKKGVIIAEVTLHVGLGTFRPVKAVNPLEHHMHAETFSFGQEACDAILTARRRGGRIIAVGTTSVRVLETVAAEMAVRARLPGPAEGHGPAVSLELEKDHEPETSHEPDASHETEASHEPILEPMEGETRIFIYPGFRFLVTDGLITNFHLPESTLMMLVSAMAGRERILEAYREAVSREYRFFSFGDAMFILPQGSECGNKYE